MFFSPYDILPNRRTNDISDETTTHILDNKVFSKQSEVNKRTLMTRFG